MYVTSYPSLNSGTMPVDGSSKSSLLEQYLHQLSGQEKEPDVIMIDHSYAKPWNAHPDSNHAKPARMLFMKGLSQQHFQNSQVNDDDEVEIDVESVSTTAVLPPYDNAKMRLLMLESERHLKCNAGGPEEKEDHIKKTGWTLPQNKLYKQVMKVLQAERLARLTNAGSVNEPVKRKIFIDKAARRIRLIFASHSWNMNILQWLHQSLMDGLSTPMLSSYLDVLRTLKADVPTLIDKMISQGVHSSRLGFTNNSSTEQLNQLIRKPWDPLLPLLNQHKPRKLPFTPLILIAPSGPNHMVTSQSRRMRFWNSQLSAIGKIVNAPVHAFNAFTGVDVSLDQIVTVMRNKVMELKNHFPNRPIILLGRTIGALIACHVALEESVSAVVCLGFPLTGVNGSRGDLDDPLLDSKVPTLFIIGQNSSTCSMDDMEDFRERMKAETGLVVVGGADDMLRVSQTKKKADGITQAMVDRCLVDEVGDFLMSVLNQSSNSSSSNYHTPSKRVYSTSNTLQQHQHQQQALGEEAKRRRRKPREFSPEISPVKRRPRQPVARQIQTPPVSKVSTSSSSSETSSTGSCASEGARVCTEVTKKSPGRKIGRAPTIVLKKQQVVKNIERNPHKQNPPSFAIKKKQENLINNVEKAPKINTMTNSLSQSPVLQESKELKPQGNSSTDVKSSQLNILTAANQQKNVPVDVEKAFGRDSSFLPRPLTPAEPEGGISLSTALKSPTREIISTVNTVTDDEHSIKQRALDSISVATCTALSQPSSKATFVGVTTSSLATFLGSMGNQKFSYIKSGTADIPATFSTQVNSTVAIQKPKVVARIADPVIEPDKEQVQAIQKLQYHDFPLTTACLSGITKSAAVTQAKILTSGGLNMKQLHGIMTPAIGKSLLATGQLSTAIKPQTILMASSSSLNPAAFLVAGSDGVASSGKKVQFRRMFVKGPSVLPTKIHSPLLSKGDKSSSASKDSSTTENAAQSFDQPACNLSLLSDVAGMKEPIRNMLKDDKEVSSSKTALMQLANMEQGEIVQEVSRLGISESQLRRLKIVGHVASRTQTPSPPQRLETPEEVAEKQMAIQVLSSSFGNEADGLGSSSAKEPSYSICYTKSDGSVVSRTVSRLGYSMMMPTSRGSTRAVRPFATSRRGRGRAVPGMSPLRKYKSPRFSPF